MTDQTGRRRRDRQVLADRLIAETLDADDARRDGTLERLARIANEHQVTVSMMIVPVSQDADEDADAGTDVEAQETERD